MPTAITTTAPLDQPERSSAARRARIVRWLALLLVAAGVLNHAQSLTWGFMWDDFIHQLVLRQASDGTTLRPWSLYDFGVRPLPGQALFETGIVPWWTDPDFTVRFFRPVTSLSILLDYRVYGDWAPGYHLTSLILFAIFLWLAFRLYRALGAPPAASLWALGLLALDEVHCLPVGWIANRNTLLAALFTVATLLAIHRFRHTARPGYLSLAVGCFLLACGSKESSVAALPILGAYLLFFGPSSGPEPPHHAVRRTLRAPVLWLFTLLTVAYLAFYVAAGYGSRSIVYPAPWTDPLRYLERVSILIPVGLFSLLFGFVADLLAIRPDLTWPSVIAGAVLVAAAASAFFRGHHQHARLSAFAATWAVCALLAEAGGDISDRLFVSASVGTSLLIGLFFEQLGPLRQRLAAKQYGRLVLAGILLLAGLAGIPMTLAPGHLLGRLAALDRAAILSADIDREAPLPRDVFVLNSPSSLMALSMSCTWRVGHDDADTRIFPLQFGRRGLVWTRADEHSMTLTSLGPPFLANRLEAVFRTQRAVPVPGSVYHTAAFAATVVTVEPAGIRTVRFRFDQRLDDPSYRFLAWQDGRLARIKPPPIGASLTLPGVAPSLPLAP